MIALFALLFVALSVQAQRGVRKAPSPKQQAEHLNKLVADLDLDEETATAFKAIVEQQGEKVKEIREADGDRMEKREQMKELRASTDEQIEELLTDEQFEKYKKIMKKNRRARGKLRNRGDGVGNG